MEKCIFDESNGFRYELQGDYYIPCLTVSDGKDYSSSSIVLPLCDKLFSLKFKNQYS